MCARHCPPSARQTALQTSHSRATRRGNFAFLMRQTLIRYWRQDDRMRQAFPEELDPGVKSCHITQYARS